MSINSALAAGASGLLANSSALAAISDNIANVNTVGYKRVDTTFTPNYKIGGGGESRYASAGVTGNSRLDMTTPGPLNPASSATDMAIDGEGFFVVRPSPATGSGADAVLFTRSGGFQTDSEGYMRNDAGQNLFAWPVQANGTVVQNPSNLDELVAVNLSNIDGTADATPSPSTNSPRTKAWASPRSRAPARARAGPRPSTATAAHPASHASSPSGRASHCR